ncbi:ammonium transporter [Nocardia sp. CNY236]|uniref:ammonium transporter n=1 Tax=Nocardia sp. CNY236 TaxID=1169152 RepID=UPI001E42C7FA|nr:ammonium transporter [Nocardia sp. CNY236]
MSHADAPETAPPNIEYRAELIGDRIVTTLSHGTFDVRGDVVDIRDEAGNVALTMPLTFRDNGLEFPLPHAVRGEDRVLELTAVRDALRARQVASPLENHKAMDEFETQLSLAVAIGGFLGTVVGALIGLTGGIAGLAAGAGIGTVIGTIIVGGPTLVIAGFNVINTLLAAPGTTRWHNKD